MNFAKAATSVLQLGVKPLWASNNGPLAQQTRNTFILRRKYPLRLHKLGGQPQKFKGKDFIYELVSDTNVTKKKPVELILMEYIDGVGQKGDRLSLAPSVAYNNYLLPGLAIYASPENIEKYHEEIERAKRDTPIFSSPTAVITLNVLSNHLLNVVVSKDHPWTLEKYHIRAAFRKTNIHVPDDAITMPPQEICGPDLDKENKEFYITVTINKKEQVKVRCRLHHHTNKEYDKIVKEKFWRQIQPAIFPEDQAILDAMPKHRTIQKYGTN